jgi:hypothetical protein
MNALKGNTPVGTVTTTGSVTQITTLIAKVSSILRVPSLMVMVICVSPIVVMGEMVLISLRLIILKLMSSVVKVRLLSAVSISVALSRDKDFFDLAVSPKGVVAVTFKNSPNYKSKSTYSLVLKVSREINNVTCVATKTIIITIIDPKLKLSSW